MEILAKRLKWLREKKRMGQKEVAAEIGMTLNGYQKIEYGERDPKLEVLVKLADIYNTTTDFILGRDDQAADLISIRKKITNTVERINGNESLLQALFSELNVMYSKLQYLESGDDEDNEKQSVEMRINNLKERVNQLEFNTHEDKQVLKKYLLDYFFEFYDIPGSNPEKDSLISEYLPINIEVEQTKNTYVLYLTSSSGEKIGLLSIDHNGDNPQESMMRKLGGYKQFFRLKH